jgi:hypothetical protein
MSNIPEQLLKDRGYDVKFYYLRCDGHPRVTVCLVLRDGRAIARGVAICVPPDGPHKVRGRQIAARRAYRAATQCRGEYERISALAREVLEDSYTAREDLAREDTVDAGVKLWEAAKTPSGKLRMALSEFEPIRTAHEKVLTKRREDAEAKEAGQGA